jgi:predicted transcriptional regulator
VHEIFAEDLQFVKDCHASTSLLTVTSFRLLGFEKTSVDLMSNKVDMSLIISRELYEKVLYEKPKMIHGLTKIPFINLYIYPKKCDFCLFQSMILVSF